MRQFYGSDERGNLAQAVGGLAKPQFIMLMSTNDRFDEHVAELERMFPGVPSIGCIGSSYGQRVVEGGVSIVAFYDGVEAVAGVLEEASTMPARYIDRLARAVEEVKGTSRDTICIDFCAGNDACVLTTLHSVLSQKGIQLIGGTGDAGRVSCNGTVYKDAVAFGLVRNLNGRVKAYKENIYHQHGDHRFIASRTDRGNYIVGSFNGRPARQVYEEVLGTAPGEDVQMRTLRNPLGKLNGEDTCIISIKDIQGDKLACYRQVNDSDVLVMLELGDFNRTVQDTVSKIAADFPKRSAVFSVNCIFRHLLFSQMNYMPAYLKQMGTLGSHAGFIGYGEHFNDRFVNQSMTCVVFE